jgi:hypothetical protein
MAASNIHRPQFYIPATVSGAVKNYDVFYDIYIQQRLKEVLRRENQGLKVYPVDRSKVFGMTGTYF